MNRPPYTLPPWAYVLLLIGILAAVVVSKAWLVNEYGSIGWFL